MSNTADLEHHQFLADFSTLSEFGKTEGGGVDRQAATKADDEQRKWLAGWLQGRGARVSIDEIGNLFGFWEFVPGAPFVIAGSHLDSQPLAGRFDGAYGVLAAAHAVSALADAVQSGDLEPKYNFAVVDWFNEEGARFQPSMMGSSVYTGKLDLEAALAAHDRDGVTVGDALAATETNGAASAPRAAGYVEIHVEQGRILEKQNITIGLVDSTWAARKYRVCVLGDQSHTGSTPMAERRDAMLGAARIIVGVRQIADDFDIHTSVSSIRLEPNSPVVVAREAELLIDMRAPDAEILSEAERALHELFASVAEQTSVEVENQLEHRWQGTPYAAEGVAYAARVAERLSLSYLPMRTIAGHDSTNMKDLVPTIMLFVPSVGGVAHNERELTKDADMLAGLAMLTEVMRGLVAGEFESLA